MMRIYRWILLTFLLAGCSADSEPLRQTAPLSPWCTWTENAGNPLIDPVPGQALLADPTFLPPDQSPDGQWHLFANALDGLYHFTSDNGTAWTQRQRSLFGSLHMRPDLFVDDGRYYLLYERFMDPLHSRIEMRESADLFEWSAPRILLEPSLDWESSIQSTNGNPFLLKRDGKYWLYFSADSVFLHDSLYFEPKYLGVAYADALTGPYVKRGEPIIGPDVNEKYRNTGAGSIKVLSEKVGGKWMALTNGIYLDDAGASHSAIMLVTSDDGINWEQKCPGPILAPESGWKQAYVYAFDIQRVGDELWVYFNARDGWFEGKERIGLATLKIPAE